MAAPRLRRRFAVAVKHETTPGTAESLGGADLVPNCFDAEIQPQINVDDRVAPGGGAGHLPSVPTQRMGTCTFTVELTGANDPAWASKLLPALGFSVSTGGIWGPDSGTPGDTGSDVETVTIGVYRDGVLKQLRGAMGTGTFRFTSGGRALLEVEFTGIWVAPSNVATPNPAYIAPVRVASGSATIGTFEPKFQEMSIALNNNVVASEDITDASGYRFFCITGRRPVATINPESTLTGTHGANVWDPSADMLASTTRALAVAFGGYDFDAPASQVISFSYADRNEIDINEAELLLAQDSAGGDDDLIITVPTA